jgi:hypothetical protein
MEARCIDRAVDARKALGPGECRLPRRPDSMVNVGYDPFSQDGTGNRIHVVDLMACRTGHGLISVAVL